MSKHTIYDVARLAGVSASTVSRVINQHAGVNNKTMERVRDALKQTDFRPRWKAAPPKSVGVIVHPHRECLADPFNANLISSISESLFAEGYIIQLIPGTQSNTTLENLSILASMHTIQGVIVIPMHLLYGMGDRLLEEHITLPNVVIGLEQHEMIERDSFCRVGVDDVAAGKQIATFLYRQNHRNFEIVCPIRKDCAHDRRIKGVLDALDSEGVDTEKIQIHEYDDTTIENGEVAAAEIVSQPELPDAVIITNGVLAMGFTRGCTQMGIKVPEDMSVVGFEDDEELVATSPPLTAMRQPTRKMGELAVQLLLQQIHDAKVMEQPKLLKHSLIIRDSTRPR